MSTTQEGVSDNTGSEDFDAAGAFTKLWSEDAEKPSEDEAEDEVNEEQSDQETEGQEDADDSNEEESSDDEADEDEGSKAEKKYADDDDVFVKIKVDGKDIEVPIKDLKRLHGQEASLTRKSQEVAENRKTLDLQAAAQIKLMEGLVERARKNFEPYAKIDFLALTKDPNISAEELSALQASAQNAYETVQYLEQDMSRFQQAIQHQRREDLKAQAKEAIKELSDPDKGIKGWGEQLYSDIRTFAIDNGLDAETVNSIVSPAAIKLLHKAMLYERGKAKVVKEPGNKKAPKKIVKSTATADATRTSVSKTGDKQAMDKLKRSGRTDDAVAAFEARFTRSSDDE